ncbi:acyltransferase [Streptomyces sp. NPDC052020]|uniref:acyltransferase family protein n=1 Tax=Streptomyces sp. NPDC052020 TaxID=3155677 RepID=UPI003419A38B
MTARGDGHRPAAGPSSPRGGTGRSPRALPSLTGLRFVAAFLVLACHTYEMIWPERVWSGDTVDLVLHQGAWAGVGFFFLLSGFLLNWPGRDERATRFWSRRAVRIYPSHLAVLGVAGGLLLLGLGDGAGPNVTVALLEAPLLHAWVFPVIEDFGVISGVSWSLSCEVFFYLCFPWLSRLVGGVPERRLPGCALALCVLVAALPLAAGALPDEPAYDAFPVSRTQFWFVYVFPLTRLAEFVLGMVLARLVAARPHSPVRIRHAVAALAVAFPLALYVPFLFTFSAVLVLPLALLIVACAHNDVRRGRSLLRRRPVVRLGELSYALFLVHLFVLQYLGMTPLAPGPGSGFAARFGWAVLTAAASLLTAWLLHVTVERPAMRRWAARTPGSRGPRARTEVLSARPAGLPRR